jgi:cytoskeleton protein RodZ
MTSVGETLRRARLQRNLELNRIADELKISASMLKAIEEERFDKLPGGVFARSFVRQYARLLELDEDEILTELKHVLQPAPEVPEISREAHVPDSEIPLPRMSGWQAVGDRGARWSSSVGALVLMVIVMLACAGAYAWWQRGRHPAAARVNAPVAAQVSHPQAATSAQPAPAAPTPEPAAPPIPAPAAGAARAEVPEAPSPALAKPVTPPAPAEAAAAVSDPNAAVRVEVVAQEPSWISVRTDGQFSFSGVLEANQTHTIAANRNVLLKLGNAGGVEVHFNGKTIGSLGGKGSVRTIQFTSGGFQIVPPEAPTPAPPTESPNPF